MVEHAHIPEGGTVSLTVETGRSAQSERRFWGAIGFFGLIGAIIPLFLFGTPQHDYVSTTSLKIEAASDADVNAAIEKLRSRASLDNLIRALNLSQAGDFAPSRPNFVGVLVDIVSGGGKTVSETEAELRTRLLDAVTLNYKSGLLAVEARASAAKEAGRVTTMLAAMFVQQLAGLAETAANPALTGMRQALERAESALSGFETQAGPDKIAEMRKFSADAQQLSTEKDAAENELQATRKKAAQAAVLKFVDVLAKPLPDSLEFTSLEYQRQRYVEAKLTVDQLSSDLGPRHPRLQAAQATVDAARKDIEDALKRLSASLRQQENAAAKAVAEIKSRADALTARQDVSDGAAKLVGLEAAVEEARDNYLQAQGQTRSTPASAAKVRVAKPLTTALTGGSWFDFLPLVAGGAFLGGLVGLAATAVGNRRRPETENLPALEQDESSLLDDHLDVELDDERLLAGDRHEDETFDPEPAIYADHEDRDDYAQAYEADADDDRDDPHWSQKAGMAQTGLTARLPQDVYAWQDEQWETEHWQDDAADLADRYEDEFEPEPEIDDRPLADRVRELLIANRRPAETESLPSLMAAAMAGRGLVEQRAANDSRRGSQPARHGGEVEELRRDMAELRELVQLYSERRTASRR